MTAAVMTGHRTGQRGTLLRAFVLACLVEALLIAFALAGSDWPWRSVSKGRPAPAEITILAAAPPAAAAPKPVTPPATPPKPMPATPPKPEKPHTKPAAPAPVHPPQPLPAAAQLLETEAADAPIVAARPALAAPELPPPPPPPPKQAGTAGAEDQLAAEVREAVQAAVRYPPAARAMHRGGRAQIAFTYRDGAVGGDPRIVVSTGVDTLDQAALAAVRNADYPPPPKEMANRIIDYLVWVEFNWLTR